MEHNLKRNRGFLLIVAVILISILSFIGLITVNVFQNQTNTSLNTLSSKQALYIAVSGLEIAKRNFTQKSIACNALSTGLTAQPVGTGQFSASGIPTNKSTTLAANVAINGSTLSLTSATGFASIGIVQIDSEYIYYTSLAGNVLSGLTRAKASSIAAAHTSGATVTQYQCYITSTGAIPTIAAPTEQSTVSSIVIIVPGISLGGSGGEPSVASGGNVSLSGNAIIANANAAVGSSNYNGSTVGIVGAHTMSISGNAVTQVDNSTGTGLVTSSSAGNIKTDVTTNIPTTPSLYSSYFGSYTPAQLQAQATSEGNYFSSSVSNISTLNGIQGGVIYINGNLSASGNGSVTLGSATAPVAIYVSGDFSLSGNAAITLYGILYINGNISSSLTGNSSISGNGSLASAGGISMSGNSNIGLAIGPGDSVISALYSSVIPGAGTPTYVTKGLGIQQVFY